MCELSGLSHYSGLKRSGGFKLGCRKIREDLH